MKKEKNVLKLEKERIKKTLEWVLQEIFNEKEIIQNLRLNDDNEKGEEILKKYMYIECLKEILAYFEIFNYEKQKINIKNIQAKSIKRFLIDICCLKNLSNDFSSYFTTVNTIKNKNTLNYFLKVYNKLSENDFEFFNIEDDLTILIQ